MNYIPEYLRELNGPQRDAVLYCDGPELVIAGAGSGKTRVLTYKIVHLLKQGVKPYSILALTFTNKAADEMRSRIQALVGEKVASKIWMGTFHSIFARILRMNAQYLNYKKNFTIYDTADSKSLLKSIIKGMELDDKVYKASSVQAVISMAKNALVSPEMYVADVDLMNNDKRCHRPLTSQIYSAYCARCKASDAMDFDDLLYNTYVLLRDNPEIKSHLQEAFQYILVDEYQDTNYAQHIIVTQLAERYHKLCVVGDDAQSIYSFRGANIRNILSMRNNYSDLALFRLEQNYRSTKMIVSAANSLIAKNSEQIPKKVFSENEPGERIEVAQCYSDLDEAYMVVNRIRELHRLRAEDYSEFAILFRTNAQSRPLEEQLRKCNIPYVIYKGQSFYQRKEIKDVVAYFRLAVNPDDDEALKRVINLPARGIGDTTVRKLQEAAAKNSVSLWTVISNSSDYLSVLNAGTWRKISGFVGLVTEFISAEQSGEKDAFELASLIIRKTGLQSISLTDSTPENISRRENIESLVSGVKEFVDDKMEQEDMPDVSLSAYLQQIALSSDQDESDDSGDAVKLMTVHSAKGLEFNNVIIVGVEDDLFPSSMSKNSLGEIEEERRLLYVAITRARKFCMMSYVKNRFRNGLMQMMSPSPFLRDIDRRYLRIVSGDMESDDYTGLSRKSVLSPSNIKSGRGIYDNGSASFGNRISVSSVSSSRRVTFGNTTPSGNVQNNADYTLHPADELKVGLVIEHSRFGRGAIKIIDITDKDAKITVDFDNTDTRVLLLKFARFKIL